MRKKWTRRIISIALIAVMTLGLATAAMADNAHFIFTDIDEPQPDLYVAKTVRSAEEGYTIPDATFPFVLKWDQDGDGSLEFAENEIYYVYNEDGTQVYNEETGSYIFRTSSTGRFTLKDGQYARFEWAGEVAYEITELGVEDFIQTEPAGGEAASGTVDGDGTYITFENLYIPSPDPEGESETTQLIIRKDISWPNGYETPDLSDVEFTFEIAIDGTAYANQAYAIYDAGVSTQTGSGYTDSSGHFTMTGDSAVVFQEVEVGVDYLVREVLTNEKGEEANPGWRATGNTSYEGATTSPMIYCYFSNAGAEFIVTKDRADGAVGTEFAFLLSDGNDSPMAAIPYYIYDENGTLTGSGTTGADGGFTLCAGERVIFTGIPDGTEYKITENIGEDFIVTADNNEDDREVTGTEDYDSLDTHTFVNEELTDITITKYASRFNTDRNLLGGVSFTLYQLKEGGDPDHEEDWLPYPNAADATRTTDDTEGSETYGMLTFEKLPAGTYRIVETKTPVGYVMAGKPIEVTLPYTLENETEGAVYSERDHLYYLYELHYTVDNNAVLDLPNTGGRAWIIILIAICGGAVALGSAYLYRRRHCGKEKVGA